MSGSPEIDPNVTAKQPFNDAAAGMPKVKKKPRRKLAVPVSLRFTEDEHVLIKQAAGSMAVSAYIRQKVLGDAVEGRKAHYLRKKPQPSMDATTIAKLLATFGHSELGRSMIALLAAVEAGRLKVTPATEEKLHGVCDDIHAIRIALITALNVKPERSR